MSDYDEEMLTEEERAALAEDDETTEPDTQAEDVDAQEAQEADDDENGDDAPVEDEPAAAQEDEDRENAQEETPAASDPTLAQIASAIDIEQVEQVLASYKEQRKEALDEYNNGEMTDEELAEKLDALNDQAAQATAQKRIFDHYEEQQEKLWSAAVKDHMERYPEFNADADLKSALNRIVQDVTGDPAYASMSFEEQLNSAHAMLEVKAKYTGMTVPPLKVAGASKGKTNTKAPKGDEDLSTPPRTLARAPASEITGGSDDEFASLRHIEENGTPDEFEAALARLPAEQRDRYSSMA